MLQTTQNLLYVPDRLAPVRELSNRIAPPARFVERVYLTNLWLENNAFAPILDGSPVPAPASLTSGASPYRVVGHRGV